MTPDELEKARLVARIAALESMLAMVVSVLANSSKTRDNIVQKLREYPASLEKMTIPGESAEYSDLIAGEGQEAIQSLVGFLVKHLARKTFDDR
jgi:hypothetical protein